ncbi:chloramphenicol-sensitive protein RarD [Sphingomonas zeicaulis]|uniref:EamA family transporter RarD n=1 Tax=Sphingomonas zeicaulis TaxID=1632740 RepID=UPI003D1AF947
MTERETDQRRGIALGIGAYGIWGLLPLFFNAVGHVSPFEVLAQRVVWSLLLVGALLVMTRRLGALARAFADRRALAILTGSATLIALNWLVYIWAVTNGHVIASSLGYFLNPLLNVLLGVLLLKERLRPIQMGAVLLAGCGVAVLAVGAGEGLWISASLALTFGFYGLLRKVVTVDALEGLAIETVLLLPPAIACLVWLGMGDNLSFGADPSTTALLVAAGPVTAVPLLLFAAAARRMPYAMLGLLQYIAPTLQFLIGVFVYHEPLTTAHLICFALIWSGLALFAVDAVRHARRIVVPTAEPAGADPQGHPVR